MLIKKTKPNGMNGKRELNPFSTSIESGFLKYLFTFESLFLFLFLFR